MSDASPVWDPRQYNRFDAQRDRAALDLLVRLPEDLDPAEIWDLGCGTGQHAALLKRRHPKAKVHGMDSSIAMLEQARALSADVEWSVGDITTWAPDRPADLILANASLQWLPDHAALFEHLADALAPAGLLAVQMPMAWETRHHALMRETATEGPWASLLAGRGHDRASAAGPGLLRGSGAVLKRYRHLDHDLSARPERRGRGAGVDEGHGAASLSDRAGGRPDAAGRLPVGLGPSAVAGLS